MSRHNPQKNPPPSSAQMKEVLGKPVNQAAELDDYDELLTEEKPKNDSAEVTALQNQIVELEKKLSEAVNKQDEIRHQYLLAMADRENEKKRWQRELDQTRQYSIQKLTQDLLPVLDTLERAIETMQNSLNQGAADESLLQAMIDGVALTLKLFGDTLNKYGVVILNPIGEPFNPNQHEALSMLQDHNIEDNHIVQVMQKGYLIGDRVVRPARVIVNKK